MSDHHNVEEFAVPTIQDTFKQMSRPNMIYSKLDLKNAYHSFKIDEDSQEVPSFTFKGRTYKWVACCFGLKTITSLFCRVMNILLGDLDGICTYVDNCVLFSESVQHAQLVKTVIDRLTSANLRINKEKCTFMKTSIFTLGFIAGPGITKIDFRKLSNIDEWKIPKSASQVQRLMGVIMYLASHIPMVSKLAHPLNELRNENKFEGKWTEQHTKHFEAIKQILLSQLILHAPNMKEKFFLQSDASLYGLSAVLFQEDKETGKPKYIAFASKSLNKHQRLWSTNRREIAAIILGLTKFRALLYGHHDIEIRTDHSSLV